jgi:RimJ/RimL family protein N-acetyltransferase
MAVPSPTRRVAFREMTPADVDLVHSQLGNPIVMWMVPAPWTRDRCQALIEQGLAWYRELGYGPWLLEDPETGEPIGQCGLNPVEVEGVGEVEIGYNIRPELWGRGLASEAGIACLDFARAADLPRVIALIDPRNERSMRTAAHIGMHYERDAVARDKTYMVWAVDFAQPTG